MINIVGIGPGNLKFMTKEAIDIISDSEVLIGGKRQLEPFKDKGKINIFLDIGFEEIVKYINENLKFKNIVVLVSGDPCYYSLYRYLKRKLNIELPIVSGINSLQYLYSRCQMTYEDGRFLSLHGRKINYIEILKKSKSIALLTDNEYTPQKIAKELYELNLDVYMYVGYKLSYEDEHIESGTPYEIMNSRNHNIAVVIVENNNQKYDKVHLTDSEFIRNNTPMTKEEIRYITLGKLELEGNQHLVDIGSGTGSISIEASKFLYCGHVTAIEKSCEAIDVMKKNILKHNQSNIKILKGNAIDKLDEIEKCDRAFIGGSGRTIDVIFDKLDTKMESGGIIVANFITLETLQQSLEYLDNKDWNYEIIQVMISKSQNLGSYKMLKAQNPIFILKIKL